VWTTRSPIHPVSSNCPAPETALEEPLFPAAITERVTFRGASEAQAIADRDDLASRLPVLDDRHVCQKHPIAPASSDHGINLVRQETRRDVSVAQLTASLQEDPGDGDGLFQQLRLAHRTHSGEIVSMDDTNRPRDEAKKASTKTRASSKSSCV
jgi:hypothetical protein